jgi:hypothetical protein
MMKLQPGKSYLWVFAIFFVMFAAALFATDTLGAVLLPVFMTAVFTSELRSGIVLDSWWQATYPRGTWQYKVGLTLHAIWAVAFAAFAVLFLSM